MKKDQLDELLKLDDEGTNKKIKKIIHKKIYSRIIIFTIIQRKITNAGGDENA